MQTMLSKRPAAASQNQVLPASFDNGNGYDKVIVDTHEIRCPAYFHGVHGRLYDIPVSQQGGLVEYVSGRREDLIGKAWLAGFPAYQKAPTAYFRTVDDKRGKLKYGLQMFLGCLATLPYREQWQLHLVASIQDAQAFGTDLTRVLSGMHTVRFNGNRKASLIHITVDAVLEEGVGAIVMAQSELNADEQVLVYDFGHGTCIFSIFGEGGKLMERKVTSGGVEDLIDAIATNLETRKHLAQEGDRQIIRSGIEDKSFNYGRTGWNFRAIYQAELVAWMQSVMAPVLRAAAPWTPTADTIIAVGGGSQLPMIHKLLTQKGITPLTDGAWANARGLYQLAASALRRV
ncbi:MAG: hypothetical protein F6K19_33880 [Cyanothece sp. SIO1E1]|nr:hypothetical protein [Cyanothece sp. SIO1E1]